MKHIDEAKQNEVRDLWKLVLEKQSASKTLLDAGFFNKEFVHTERFPEQVARDFEYLFESRQSGDYDYHVSFDEDEARTGPEKANLILVAIRDYVETEFRIPLDIVA